MPVSVVKRGKKFCAVEKGKGPKKGRCHASRSMAVRQSRAINRSLRLSGKIK